jgi:hypothetical protein
LLAVLIPPLIAFVPATLRHICAEGDAIFQWLIPLLCLWMALLAVGTVRTRRGLAIGLSVSMYFLTWQHGEFAHSDAVTGSPTWDRTQRAASGTALRHMKKVLLERSQTDDTNYPAGWLRDLPLADALAGTLARRPLRGGARPLWHSSFTTLYGRVRWPQDYWYPGGPLQDAAERIELRDRPSDEQ